MSDNEFNGLLVAVSVFGGLFVLTLLGGFLDGIANRFPIRAMREEWRINLRRSEANTTWLGNAVALPFYVLGWTGYFVGGVLSRVFFRSNYE